MSSAIGWRLSFFVSILEPVLATPGVLQPQSHKGRFGREDTSLRPESSPSFLILCLPNPAPQPDWNHSGSFTSPGQAPPGAQLVAGRSPEPCSERQCQPCFSALTHRTASLGQWLPGHARAMRVALPPRAAKAWITAATCPSAAAVVLGAQRGEGLEWGAWERTGERGWISGDWER